MDIRWNKQKAIELHNNRQIEIKDIALLIKKNETIKVVKHPNFIKYPNQFIAYVWYKQHIHSVPYVLEDNIIFIKTAYPNSKITKKYLNGKL